jgi:hypothetical protein
MAHAARKYLKNWAEPEAALARALPVEYDRALVVPAFRESASLLTGYARAAETSRGTTLCILVVNAPDDATEAEYRQTASCLDGVLASLSTRSALSASPGPAALGTASAGKLDVLVVDRASPGVRISRKGGVGLARKIGFDIALALHSAGKLRSRFLYGTDADATLPERHFDEAEKHADAAAVLFPFWHRASSDPGVTRATAHYEASLRYYVAGLAFAGSPYAFHTLGSAMAVSAEAYASVRGMPKREAAEDFYLLNKVAKVGRVALGATGAVTLESRESGRTPFGTGAAVADALRGAPAKFYSPACFVALRAVLATFTRFAEHGDVNGVFTDLERSLSEAEHGAVSSAMGEKAARAALEASSRDGASGEDRLRRVHTWFDAFHTRKVVHALRDRVYPGIPALDALRSAPFVPNVPDERSDAMDAFRRALANDEERRTAILGLPVVGANLIGVQAGPGAATATGAAASIVSRSTENGD